MVTPSVIHWAITKLMTLSVVKKNYISIRTYLSTINTSFFENLINYKIIILYD